MGTHLMESKVTKRAKSLTLILMTVLSGMATAAEDDNVAEKKKDLATLFTRRPMAVERERPAEWDNLVFGGQFMDRFEPMPVQGKLTSETWGGENVRPRYTNNGIEDDQWTYWGGNALLGKDGRHHLIVCRWLESSPTGHAYYHWSDVVHAVADTAYGPYEVVETLFPGHNPILLQLEDGRYVIRNGESFWVGSTESEGGSTERFKTLGALGDAWKEVPLELHMRERVGRSQGPMAFAQREDGSFIMLTRHGDIWFSETGISPYYRYTDERVYPAIAGRFEDPAIWRTNVQYHLITNDWQGRIAYHMRSKDGLHWKLDPGVAYEPGIGKVEGGTVNDWYKYEVIRISQDEHGRAIRANFAAIDSPKAEDLGSDQHNSKNLFIPLTPGKLLTVLNDQAIDLTTREIRVRIEAERGFNPHKDMDLDSLRFGAPEEVDFGRGCKLARTQKSGNDLILIFDGKGNGLTADNFAGKLLGRTTEGTLLFGYARLPGVDYLEPALSALPARFIPIDGGIKIEVEVQNFGQVASETSTVEVLLREGVGNYHTVRGEVPPLKPFGKTVVELIRMENITKLKKGAQYTVTVQLDSTGRKPETLTREVIVLP